MDDHSRLIVGHRWGRHEDVLRLEAALRRGIASRGVPGRIYVDYAEVRVMPTSTERSCSAGANVPMLSA
jgi:hypothetical protein